MADDIKTEHELLRRQVEALQREHDALEAAPFDPDEHAEHRARLKAKLVELKAHMTRIRSEA